MDQLSLSVFIIPSGAFLFMIILVAYAKKKAAHQRTYMHLLWSITVCSFILNFAWEMLQMPLFLHMSPGWQSTLFCALASVADTIMVLLIYYGFACLYNNNWWMIRPKPYRVMTLVFAGGAGAVLAEMRHTNLGTWIYSPLMPIIPGTKVGLVPVLQFIILPGIIYYLALSLKLKDLKQSAHIQLKETDDVKN